jgi:cytochrome P450
MDDTARDWRTEFDMTDPTFGDRFDAISDDLVAGCPMARTVDGEWVVSRHADVTRVLLDSDTFCSGTGIRGANFRPRPEELLKPNEMDQPEHGWLRHSWDRHFTTAAVAGHEPEIRRIIHGLIDDFVDDGEVELVGRFAEPLACRAFCQAVANMPVDDMPFLQRTFQAALAGRSVEERTENWMTTHEYVGRFLAERREQPRRDDIVDTILHFEYPDGRPYPDAERASSLMQVTAAGLVTTGAIVSGAIHHLATTPADRQRLAADPALIPRAVEEFLRVFAAAPMIGRRATADTEIAGQAVAEGEFLWYNIGGANRDPAVFDDPGVLDIDRTPNKHLTFATGRHRCLGPNFARMNIRVAIEAFLERIADFSVRPGFTPAFEAGMTRRMTSLDLVFDKAAR